MAIVLSEGQQELIKDEAGRFAAQVQNEAAKKIYERLVAEAESGSILEEMASVLGDLLGMGLVTGRIRSLYGAHAEMDAQRLFAKTPQGQALSAQFDEANKALEALADQRIEKVSLSARGPGLYSLTIQTDESRIVASLDESGVHVRSLEVSA